MKQVLLGAVTFFVGIQLVPYGRDHTNPTTNVEPTWDSPATRQAVVGVCFDCHSNQTKWPWYSNIAPVSWVVQHHVDEGRETINFSEWNQDWESAEDAAEEVAKGRMPMGGYDLMHPEAALTPAQRTALADGLERTLGGEGGERGEREERGERVEREEREEREEADER